MNWNTYVRQWKSYLLDRWELDNDFSDRAASLCAYCVFYGLNPVVTSGFRSIERQAELVAAWRSGNPDVHTPLPPGKSLHNNRSWIGTPAALAMDMVTNDYKKAAIIAKHLGIVWGGNEDPVHFAARRGTL